MEKRTITIVAVTATTRQRLRDYFKKQVDFLDWENYSERYEGAQGVPLGMFTFPLAWGAGTFDNDTRINERAYQPFVEALKLESKFNMWETKRADFRMEYHSDYLDFCVLNVEWIPYGDCGKPEES